MLKGKTVILGVTGSIAAYKIANLASMLSKQHANVHVIMTKNATNFINPITFETLTGNKCLIDTFDRNFKFSVEHVSLAKTADILMIAPASANIIGKMANGIADDMLTTTFLACKCPIFVSPAMNTRMYENPIVQNNIQKLKDYNINIIDPACGMLACKDTGAGKMPEPVELYKYIYNTIAFEKILKGKKILITAGPTREAIDPVRFITNHSTGKMGYAIANVATAMGADVTLVTGPTNIAKPLFTNKVINISDAKDMFEAVKSEYDNVDIVIKSAAVADFTPENYNNEKTKKNTMSRSIPLKPTTDILKYLGENKKHQFLCGFSMETENMFENSKRKLERKNLDMIVANNLKVKGAGFGTDTNIVTVITKDDVVEFPIMSKEDVAKELLTLIYNKTK